MNWQRLHKMDVACIKQSLYKMDLLEIIADFEERHGRIPESKTGEYADFIESQLKIGFRNKSEAIDMVLLYEYMSGYRCIIDSKTGKKRKIQKEKPEDLILLGWGNLNAKDSKGKRLNKEEFKLATRLHDKEGYREARDRIINYLGIVVPVKDPEKTDLEKLIKYVLGKKFIFDRKTGKKRKIQKGKLEDLILLSYTNAYANNDAGQKYNYDLYRLACRFYSRSCEIHKNYSNYPEAMKIIFEKPEVIDYFGAKPSYKEHVKMKTRPKKTYERTDRPMQDYILKKLIPLWLSYRENNDLSTKEKLFEYYSRRLCKPICAIILKDFPQVRIHYNSPEELLQFTYDELNKRIETYDITAGFTFATYSYTAIRGRIIDAMRTEGIMERKSIKKKKKRTKELDGPRSRDEKIKLLDLLGSKDDDEIDLDCLLDGLSFREKTLFIEHGLEGKSYKEIKTKLNIISKSQSSQIYSKAVKKVRKNYELAKVA